MTPAQLLTDAFERILQTATAAVDGLSDEQLAARPTPDANSIAWLVWHLARVQDDHVADVAGTEQVWTAQDFVTRFDLPFDTAAMGYGMSSEEVGHVRAERRAAGRVCAGRARRDGRLRRQPHRRRTSSASSTTRWDPPVTLGVRLVSVVSDDLQHAGQAAYVRGLVSERE